MKAGVRPNYHTVIDARGRELHQLIAQKIRRDPELLQKARETLARWLGQARENDRSRDSLTEWQALLERPLEEILSFIASDDEEPNRLRQSSPFAGILTEEERGEILRKYESFRP